MEGDKSLVEEAQMISSTSPYQSTTEPVTDRRPFIAGFVIDIKFIKSKLGMLQIAEMVLNIIVAICIACISYCSDSTCSSVSFLQFVAISSLIFNITLYIMFTLTFHLMLTMVNWPLTILLNNIIYSFLHMIASIWIAVTSSSSPQTAATIFSFISMLVYFTMAYFSLLLFRIHQRKHTVSHIQGVSGTVTS